MREHGAKKDTGRELRVHGKKDNASFQVIVLVSLSHALNAIVLRVPEPCTTEQLLTPQNRAPLVDLVKTA